MLAAEFSCRPSDAWEEVQRVPVGFLQDVILYRRYAAAYFANQADPTGWQQSPMRTTAMEIEHTVAAEAIARG